MRKLTTALMFSLSLVCLSTADAQLFGKRPKAPPAQRIGELIVQARSDPNESKRAAAAGELREFDTKTFPEVVPVLIDAAKSDKSATVRHEALDSLSRIRPVSQAAGQMLEWAAAHDESWKVRWQAKTALTRYQWAGYHAAKNDPKASKTPMTQEPPLIDSPRPQAKNGVATRPTPTKSNPQPTGNYPQQVPLPAIVNQPAPVPQSPRQQRVVVQPPPKVSSTPPPIIIEAPTTVIAPAPKGPVPAVPVLDLGPRVGAPPVPVVAPPTGPAEPNFRPAGQAPPRVAPPTKNDDRGPALTPPM